MVEQNWNKEVRSGEEEHEVAGNRSLTNAYNFIKYLEDRKFAIWSILKWEKKLQTGGKFFYLLSSTICWWQVKW